MNPMALLGAGTTIGSAPGVVGSIYPPLGRHLNQLFNGGWQNALLDPLTILTLKRRGAITTSEYKSELALHGISEANAEFLDISDDLLLNAGELLENYRSQCMIKFSEISLYLASNQSLTQAQIDTKWNELATTKTLEFGKFKSDGLKIGIQNSEANKIKNALRVRPTTADILLFMARESFEPESITAFRLNEGLPREFREFCKIVDMEEFEIQAFWSSHWQHVSPAQFADIRARFGSHRTDLTADDFTKLGIAKSDIMLSSTVEQNYPNLVELAPYWAKRLEYATKKPIPIIFLRWGYERGIMNSLQIKQALLDHNYDPRAVDLMVKITETKYQPEKDIALQNNTYEKYRRSLISYSDAKTALVAAGYIEATVIVQLDLIKNDIDLEVQENKLKIIFNKFKQSIITETQMNTMIDTLISSTTKRSLIKSEFIDLKDSIIKKLEKGDIVKAVKNEIMTYAVGLTRLQAIHYTLSDAEILLHDYKPVVTP